VLIAEDERVAAYKEKPAEKELHDMAASGTVLKETVMFIASVSAVMRAAASLGASLREHISKLFTASGKQLIDVFLRFEFMDTTYLFESAKNLKVIKVNCPFVDVGRYSSLYQLLPKDEQSNATLGNVVLSGNCNGNLIINRTAEPLVVIDQQQMVIVHTPEGYVHAPFTSIDTVGEIYKSKLYYYS
jgi:mannose-1-phosphate guanylyltransferase